MVKSSAAVSAASDFALRVLNSNFFPLLDLLCRLCVFMCMCLYVGPCIVNCPAVSFRCFFPLRALFGLSRD